MPRRPFIDAHVHINPWDRLHEDARRILEKTQPAFKDLRRYFDDPDAFVALLDEEGVEKAALINYVAPVVMGYTKDVNDWVADYVKDHRDRLIPFGSIDPLFKGNAGKEIDRLLSTLELGGIKIHPPHMLVSPNAYLEGNKVLRTLYERCEAAGIPVMVHTGTSVFPGARNKFGDPMPIDDVALDFPKLKIILAHAGRPLWMETATFLARRHPNVWFDISSIPPKKLLEYLPRLADLSDKAIFGSDWPGPYVPSMRENADAVAKLKLSTEALDRILAGNARNVFG